MGEILTIDLHDPDEQTLQRAANVVRSGGLIVYPTETLYGVGADATNPLAIKKVHEVKLRAEHKPILIIVDSIEMMSAFVDDVSSAAQMLMEKFWPGPLTLVFKASERVPVELAGGSGTVGIRIPSSHVCLRLLAHLGRPLTSSSANRTGERPSRRISEIQSQLRGIDLYLDGGELPESEPSTVVDVTGVAPRVLRSGAITSQQMDQVLLRTGG